MNHQATALTPKQVSSHQQIALGRKDLKRQSTDKNNKYVHRLRKRLNAKKNSKMPRTKAIQTLGSLLPARLVNFIEVQIDLHTKCSKHGNRYSGQTKAFALSLYHLSGKAYKLISKLFCLPSKSSLKKWVFKLPNCPGFTQSAIEVISSKVATMNDKGKLCVISFNEISLKCNLAYQSNTDELIGLEDYGDGNKTNCLATYAIVFLWPVVLWKTGSSLWLIFWSVKDVQ